MKIIIWVLVIVFSVFGCTPRNSGNNPTITDETDNTSVRASREENDASIHVEDFSTISDWVNVGARWKEDDGTLFFSSRAMDMLDLGALSQLSEADRLAVRDISITDLELVNQSGFSFSLFPNLLVLDVGPNNLETIHGIGDTSMEWLELTGVAVSDISEISRLQAVDYIWIRTDQRIERLPDLSGLNDLYRLAIQANPLGSLDGIQTLSRPVGLVLGLVEDVSALEQVNPADLPIAMFPRHQRQQPHIVARLKELGFEVVDSFE